MRKAGLSYEVVKAGPLCGLFRSVVICIICIVKYSTVI